jgi:opacity protein-like surface antigen
MKLKSLLFGSAAIMAAGTGAQAADLPTAEPVEYVRICDAFGTGFYYIPGTDTCLKVGGRVRVEAHWVETDSDDPLQTEFNNWTTRARGYVKLDARTQTDWGMVRAYVSLQMTVGPSDFANDYDSTSPAIDQAFIQISNDWGTWTAGHTSSFFDLPFSSNTFGTRVFIDDPTTEQTLFALTKSFGNGFSATISLEDPASSGRRKDGPYDVYEGQELPDIVGNLRLDQGWGSVMIAGVAHVIHDQDGFESDHGADVDDTVGWAVNAGFNINVPGTMFGAGLSAGYADGAIGYITNDVGGAGDFSGPDSDNTNTAWQVRGGVSAAFTPHLTAYVDASFTSVDADDSPAGLPEIDYDYTAVAADLQWSPVSGLVMGPEVAWSSTDFDDDVRSDDFDVWGVMWRIQRDF